MRLGSIQWLIVSNSIFPKEVVDGVPIVQSKSNISKVMLIVVNVRPLLPINVAGRLEFWCTCSGKMVEKDQPTPP